MRKGQEIWILMMIAVGLFVLPFRNVSAQEKKAVKPEDYNLWNRVTNTKISEDGNWIAYSLAHQLVDDSLFLKNTSNTCTIPLSKGKKGEFSKDSKWFTWLDGNGNLRLMELGTEQIEVIPDVYDYEFSPGGRFLAMRIKNDQLKFLLIKDLDYGSDRLIENVSEYSFSQKNVLVVIIKEEDHSSVGMIRMENSKKLVSLASSQNSFLKLTWHSSGESIVFYEELLDPQFKEKNHKIHYITNIGCSPSFYSFDPVEDFDLPERRVIPSVIPKLLISKDQKRVFFEVGPWTRLEPSSNTEDPVHSGEVQIWNAKDKIAYPGREFLSWPQKSPKLSVWWPFKSKSRQIGSVKKSKVILTGDQHHAIMFNPNDYSPRFDHKEDFIDVYLTDLATGKEKLLIEKQLYKFFHTLVSPGGKYISYFKDKHWWIYDLEKGTHTNITEKLEYPVHDFRFDRGGIKPPYGNPGWTANDSGIVIYDQYDIWIISPDGATSRRITNGRRNEVRFRVYEKFYKTGFTNSFYGFTNFSLDQEMILESKGLKTKKTGFSIWEPERGLEEIVFGDQLVRSLNRASNGSYTYMTEKYDTPPHLFFQSGPSGTPVLLTQSNSHHTQFLWGKSSLVSYSGPGGEKLNGALFYPADYDPQKRYPLIVSIYERKSDQLHHYVPPSKSSSSGFNVSNFTSDGYFVLYPDIMYTMNDPGRSALESVESAVQEVLEEEIIDPERIGLIGQSFGGYETSFIISQSNLFRAAIAGNPLTDLLSSYLGIIWNDRRSAFWRFESQIMRFKGSYFDFPEEYIRNSPVHNAEGINTPLLTWFGTEDGQVEWSQGIELYLALRRLKKEHIFLVYPDEGHVLSKEKNKKDLTKRTKQWFDYYLKGLGSPDWIIEPNN